MDPHRPPWTSVDHGEDGWDHQPGAQQPRMPGFRQGWQNGQGPEDLPQEPHDLVLGMRTEELWNLNKIDMKADCGYRLYRVVLHNSFQ